MKQLIIYSILCLFLSGCWSFRWQGNAYKEQVLNGKPIKYTELDESDKKLDAYAWYSDNDKVVVQNYFDKNGKYYEKKTVDLCSWFLLPLNFLDTRVNDTDEAAINQAIQNFQKEDSKIKGLRYIEVGRRFEGFLVLGNWCKWVTGFPIYEDVKYNVATSN